MLFKEIIGQQVIKERLIATVRQNKVSHAWLFFGSEGTGALPLAIAYARYLACTNRGLIDSCGTCPSCTKYNKLIHPDLHFSFPVNKTKSIDKESVISDDFLPYWRNFILKEPYGGLIDWYDFIELENKQGIINTEESKNIARKLSFKPFESDYKICIIWHPEKMNDQAANKLLKLLEEPPPLTVFMLITENPEQLLTTVRSRCVQVKIPPIDSQSIRDALQKFEGPHQSKLEEMIRLSSGNYLKAIELTNENAETGYDFEKFRELMRICFKSAIPEMMKICEELASLTREKQKSFLEFSLRMIRESMAFHFKEEDIVYVSGEEKNFTPNFAPFVTGKNIGEFYTELSEAYRDIERNANGRIVFLDLSLKLTALFRK